MEGGILNEFSSLNTVGGGAAERRGGKPTHYSNQPMASKPKTEHERLLGGEKTYTSALGDESSQLDHFVDDQPSSSGMMRGPATDFLPEDASKEERYKLLRRLEMCAKAREESTKIMSCRFAQRDAVKDELVRTRQNYLTDMYAARREREESWGRKLQRSPFAVDLVAENQRIDEENRVRDHIEQRKQKLMHQRNREAHNAIFKRAVAESDELDVLRQEKRALLANEKLLKAMRDVERSNARTAQILQERQACELEKQQKRIQDALRNGITA